MSTVKAKREFHQKIVDSVFTEKYFERCMELEVANKERRGSYHEHFIGNMNNKFDTCGEPWCISNMHHKNVDSDGVPYGPVYHCPKWMKEHITEFVEFERNYNNIPF